MIELFFWPTPNGYKPLIALEEFGLPYRISLVNIFRGVQFEAEFLAVAPNNRIPAILDHDGGAAPLALFESGAILLYLAEQAGQLPASSRQRHDTQQWVFWQMGGLGPMMGQASHFLNYAPEDVPYAKARYVAETRRLFGVMERRLADRRFLAGDYSVADMACYPWVRLHDIVGITIADTFPALAAWTERIGDRPAVRRAYAVGEPLRGDQAMDEAARPHLFGAPAR